MVKKNTQEDRIMTIAVTQPTTSGERYSAGLEIWRSMSAEEQAAGSRQLAQMIAERGQLPLAIAAAVVASVRASELRYWSQDD